MEVSIKTRNNLCLYFKELFKKAKGAKLIFIITMREIIKNNMCGGVESGFCESNNKTYKKRVIDYIQEGGGSGGCKRIKKNIFVGCLRIFFSGCKNEIEKKT